MSVVAHVTTSVAPTRLSLCANDGALNAAASTIVMPNASALQG